MKIIKIFGVILSLFLLGSLLNYLLPTKMQISHGIGINAHRDRVEEEIRDLNALFQSSQWIAKPRESIIVKEEGVLPVAISKETGKYLIQRIRYKYDPEESSIYYITNTEELSAPLYMQYRIRHIDHKNSTLECFIGTKKIEFLDRVKILFAKNTLKKKLEKGMAEIKRVAERKKSYVTRLQVQEIPKRHFLVTHETFLKTEDNMDSARIQHMNARLEKVKKLNSSVLYIGKILKEELIGNDSIRLTSGFSIADTNVPNLVPDCYVDSTAAGKFIIGSASGSSTSFDIMKTELKHYMEARGLKKRGTPWKEEELTEDYSVLSRSYLMPIQDEPEVFE